MQVIEYFTTEQKEHWLNEIKKCDWGAGQYLYQLLSENKLKKMVGETSLVPMLVDGDTLVAFCTFAPMDDIQPTNLSPWIGFSCNHCFLGEWCGGCRSVFSCCSYGAFQESGTCPNIECCQEKGIDGCYECKELENCTKGFYQPDNDGANACKAQAMFIQKYGKEKFLQAHDKLHEVYDFKKTQEILGTSVEEGVKILEETGKNGN